MWGLLFSKIYLLLYNCHMTNQTIGSLETQEISLRLEHYDDIFSDFDMRPYDKRALSADFLDEMKRATKEKNGGIELVLHSPTDTRNEEHENTIRGRLNEHFTRHKTLLQQEKKKMIGFGSGMVIMGIICMVAATFVMFNEDRKDLLTSFLIVFLEPAAWFLLWEGMDQIIFHSKEINPELSFYRKMSNPDSKIDFRSY